MKNNSFFKIRPGKQKSRGWRTLFPWAFSVREIYLGCVRVCVMLSMYTMFMKISRHSPIFEQNVKKRKYKTRHGNQVVQQVRFWKILKNSRISHPSRIILIWNSPINNTWILPCRMKLQFCLFLQSTQKSIRAVTLAALLGRASTDCDRFQRLSTRLSVRKWFQPSARRYVSLAIV